MPGKKQSSNPPKSFVTYQNTQRILSNIQRQLGQLSEQKLTPTMRQKLKELKRVHGDMKRSYANYASTSLKHDVNSMFDKVLSKMKTTRRGS